MTENRSAAPNRLLLYAAVNGAMAILLGTFAAHGAEASARALLATGSQYQMVHAVVALALAIARQVPQLGRIAGWTAATGGLVFSLSLTTLALTGLRVAGVVAPIGGILMIMAWLLLGLAAFRSPTPAEKPR